MTPDRPRVTPGRSWPLGVTPDEGGANVAVWAPHAERVELCLFDDDGAETRVPLPYNDGGIWHASIAGVAPLARYGLRVSGPASHVAAAHNEHKLLIDPYARALDTPARWHPRMDAVVDLPVGHDVAPARDDRDSADVVPKGIVLPGPTGPDPAANRPLHDRADLVVYEAHVKGLSMRHPGVPEHLRGTYAGAGHSAVLEHLVALGVNAVEFLPLQAFFDDRGVVDRGLTNYWGYQPIAWHAPEPRYAAADADAELRGLVHALHEAGIEVIVDVVYNHTGEGGEGGPVLSLRGLNEPGYYRMHHGAYIDDTGTGNTLAAERPMVLRLILDSLRHWARRYGVDGFRFDLAAAVGRGSDGFDPMAAFFQAVRQDPELAGLRLIAEPWDVGPGGYQLGAFGHPWSEWNDRFRDDVRRAWRGDPLAFAALSRRVLGSAETFDHGQRAATASINFVTAHDGFTLADLVSHSRRHNDANGEDGRDGHAENFSDGLGVEGDTDDPDILAARSRRARAMLGTLLVAQGVPMLLAGDELGNGQRGNNNAYAQDNETGWLDWSGLGGELLDFVRCAVAARHRLPVLRQETFLHGGTRADGRRDVEWVRADGGAVTDDDWRDPDFRTVVVVLRGAADDPRGASLPGAVAILINTGGDVDAVVPGSDSGAPWRVEFDTARPQSFAAGSEAGAHDPAAGPYPVLAQSVVLLSCG
ncbi:glycogen debranching protein GlgX [Microbacterium halophytorum]|uniref:glycogen debranching protein GlgX n=1 Tax=Microbacterium halophytorum TaxID=2067568 RepID=UPI000CFC276D|nr:glycogen debranching protein GlgX [Microbacterium halophytorum]